SRRDRGDRRWRADAAAKQSKTRISRSMITSVNWCSFVFIAVDSRHSRPNGFQADSAVCAPSRVGTNGSRITRKRPELSRIENGLKQKRPAEAGRFCFFLFNSVRLP